MIEIITANGVSLDLKQDQEFEVTLEQPMLSEDRIPVPYSTSIAFIASPKNRQTFKYLGAMMMEPEEKKLEVEIRGNGIPLFYGTLEYESIEDGDLTYTFSGKDIADDLNGYIHQVSNLTRVEDKILTGTVKILAILNNAARGTHEEFGLPMLVNKANITEVEYANNLEKDSVEAYSKYQNYVWTMPLSVITPAVRISRILSGKIDESILDSELQGLYSNLAILGQYKDENSFTNTGISGSQGNVIFDVAKTLPECTLLDLLLNVSKMMCASMFRDGKSYRVKCNSTILKSSDILDWDAKTDDDISASKETGKAYVFGYSNDDENTYNPTGKSDKWENDNIIEVQNAREVLSVIQENVEYVAVRNTSTGDMYSGKQMVITDNYEVQRQVPFLDILLHDTSKVDTTVDEKETFDNTVAFKVVCCMPTKTYTPASFGVPQYAICPVLDFPAIGDERSTDVWIGVLLNNQLIDKGEIFAIPSNTSGESNSALTSSLYSIAPAVLFKNYHQRFADWIAKDRQVITVSLLLDMVDIQNFRMWKKLSIRNRIWLPMTMRFVFNTNRGGVETTADLIEVV